MTNLTQYFGMQFVVARNQVYMEPGMKRAGLSLDTQKLYARNFLNIKSNSLKKFLRSNPDDGELKYLYAVRGGTCPGVYSTRTVAFQHSQGLPNESRRKFSINSHQAAEEFANSEPLRSSGPEGPPIWDKKGSDLVNDLARINDEWKTFRDEPMKIGKDLLRSKASSASGPASSGLQRGVDDVSVPGADIVKHSGGVGAHGTDAPVPPPDGRVPEVPRYREETCKPPATGHYNNPAYLLVGQHLTPRAPSAGSLATRCEQTRIKQLIPKLSTAMNTPPERDPMTPARNLLGTGHSPCTEKWYSEVPAFPKGRSYSPVEVMKSFTCNIRSLLGVEPSNISASGADMTGAKLQGTYQRGDEETLRVQSLTNEMVACVNEFHEVEGRLRVEKRDFQEWRQQTDLQRRAMLAHHHEEIHLTPTNAANKCRHEYIEELGSGRFANQAPLNGRLLEHEAVARITTEYENLRNTEDELVELFTHVSEDQDRIWRASMDKLCNVEMVSQEFAEDRIEQLNYEFHECHSEHGACAGGASGAARTRTAGGGPPGDDDDDSSSATSQSTSTSDGTLWSSASVAASMQRLRDRLLNASESESARIQEKIDDRDEEGTRAS